jgi:hypothetical protein
MKSGKMLKPGDVILVQIQFIDTFEIKKRPAVILLEEHNNFVVAGITSNKDMQGIKLTKKEGAIKPSTIRLNYIFTISKTMIYKQLFSLNKEKKKLIFKELTNKLKNLDS